MLSLEQEVATPFKDWAIVLFSLRHILTGIFNPHNPKREYHGQIHPKNIFRSHLVQYKWHRAVRDCLTDGIYGLLPYLPPEAVEDDAVPSLKWDTYAFGVIMWQLVEKGILLMDCIYKTFGSGQNGKSV